MPKLIKVRTTKVSARQKPTPTYETIACLIAGNDAPSWLAGVLEWMSQSAAAERSYETKQPRRSKLRDDFLTGKRATALLMALCKSPIGRSFLEEKPSESTIPGIYAELQALDERLTAGIRLLQGPDRNTTRGPHKARIVNSFPAKVLLASRIAEVWSYFHGRDPGDRNPLATEAAELYWVISGGKHSRASDLYESWRPHFRRAKIIKTQLASSRSMWRIDLDQAARRGRAPFFHKDIPGLGGK
jgi:hypothetical protein